LKKPAVSAILFFYTMSNSTHSASIALDRKSPVPLYLQISNQLKDHILRGDIFVGKRLPSTRKLAQSLGLDRSTVLLAYSELYSDGLIAAHVGKGTVVVDASEVEKESFQAPASMRWDDFFASSNNSAFDTTIQKNNDWIHQKEIISLAGGDPAPDMVPAREIERIVTRLCRTDIYSLLRASSCQGLPPLREMLATDMIRGGSAVSPEEIVITAGSVQALSLLSRVLLDPGDVVVVEKPTFYGALQIFRAAQARIVDVPVDAEGMRIDALERILKVHKPKFVYTMPAFQNPSGAVLSLERKKALLNLAYRHQFGIIEEDPVSRLFFDREPAPSLKSLDKSAAVIHVSSISKTLFPGFRIGWIICTRLMAKRLATVRQYEDIHSNTLGQHVLLEFLRDGLYDRHLERIRSLLVRRRDAMIAALAEHCAPALSWNTPAGGFYIWCRLKSGLRSNEVVEELLHKKVATIPGTAFFVRPEEGADRLRLCYSYESEDKMRLGIRLLGQIARGLTARKKGKPDVREIDIKAIV